MQSPKFSLNGQDIAHIGRHVLYAALAAGIGYLVTVFQDPNLQVTGTAATFIPLAVLVLTTVQSFFKGQ